MPDCGVDLLARDRYTNDAQISDAVVAGRLALNLLNTASYGVDIVGIQIRRINVDADGAVAETVNMDENENVLERSAWSSKRRRGGRHGQLYVPSVFCGLYHE